MSTIENALATSWTEVWLILVTAGAMVASTVLYTRIAGLRSFSKFTTYDFAVTIAIGSVIGATTASTGSSLLNGVVALAGLFMAQAAFALIRRTGPVGRMTENRPLLLMAGERIIHENLRRARVTEDDVLAKLREANVLRLESVQAVILEVTGDISVLHGDEDVEPDLVGGVRGAERLRGDAGGDTDMPAT